MKKSALYVLLSILSISLSAEDVCKHHVGKHFDMPHYILEIMIDRDSVLFQCFRHHNKYEKAHDQKNTLRKSCLEFVNKNLIEINKCNLFSIEPQTENSLPKIVDKESNEGLIYVIEGKF